MPEVFVLSGLDVGRSFKVGHGATFGRHPKCTAALRDRSVSRHHAHLEFDGQRWAVVDDGSRNGLFVGDRRVDRAPLGDGDQFRLGELRLRFREEALEPEPTPPAAPSSAEKPQPSEAPRVPRAEGGRSPGGDELPGDPANRALAPSTQPAPPTEPPPTAGEPPIEEEIELEDEPEILAGGGVAPSAPARPDPPRPPAAGEKPRDPMPRAPRRQRSPERERELAALAATAAMRRPAAGSSPGGVDLRGDSDRILQYHRTADRSGFFAADLSQYPAWVRALAYALAALIAVALFYLAFRAVGVIKGRVAEPEPAIEEPGE